MIIRLKVGQWIGTFFFDKIQLYGNIPMKKTEFSGLQPAISFVYLKEKSKPLKVPGPFQTRKPPRGGLLFFLRPSCGTFRR
jgi:hypothetical protein